MLLVIAGLSLLGAAPAETPVTFIVVLRDGVSNPAAVAREHATQFGGQLTFVYQHALKGYAIKLAPGRSGAISADSRVAYVEPDSDVHASITTENNATWGLENRTVGIRVKGVRGEDTHLENRMPGAASNPYSGRVTAAAPAG